MKILIFGAGAIGSAFGGFLSKTEHEIFLYGRARHLSKVKRDGLIVEGIFGKHRFRNLKVVTQARMLQKFKRQFDFILLCVKSYDTERAAKEIKKIVSPETLVVSLQNGLGNIETLHRYFPKKQVLAGRVIFGVDLSRGKIKITVWGGDVLVGETDQKNVTSRATQLAKLFSSTGIKSKAVPNVQKWLWAKAIYNCALNPLASLFNTHYGALLEAGYTREIMETIVRECYQVATAWNIHLEPKSAQSYIKLLFGKLIPDTYDHRPSMLADLKRGKRTEIRYLNGAIVRMGTQKRVSVFVNEWIVSLIQIKESLLGKNNG